MGNIILYFKTNQRERKLISLYIFYSNWIWID